MQHLESNKTGSLTAQPSHLTTADATQLLFPQIDDQSISVNLFGEVYKNPIIMGLIGVQGLFHGYKEMGVAEVCGAGGPL